jgi:cell division protein FtsQ
LIRRDLSSLSVQEARAGKHRKRVDVSLGTPGAEMRLPSIPSIHFGWRLLSALAVLALAGALYYLWTTPTFRVQKAQIHGAMRVDPADINMVLGLDNEPVFLINPAQLKQNIAKAFPEMEAITVEVKMPASLQVTVKERQPVLIWKQDGREDLWVDAEGISFPPRGDIGPLPILQGQFMTVTLTTSPEKTLPRLDPKLVAAVLKLSKQLSEGVSISFDPEHGFTWRDPHNWQVYFGMDFENMDVKLQEYQNVANKLIDEGITPVLVSVEFTHAPYYRLER